VASSQACKDQSKLQMQRSFEGCRSLSRCDKTAFITYYLCAVVLDKATFGALEGYLVHSPAHQLLHVPRTR